ncbi:MAG: DinB family protein [Pseudomonadota bacterium]
MITVGHVQTMAHYNAWQNTSLVAAADTLTDEARREDRGAFFGSIQRTFSHLLWADQIWISRFAGTPKPDGGIPQSGDLYAEWEHFKETRQAIDETFLSWSEALEPIWLDGDLTWWSRAANSEVRKPKSLLVTHVFNHQTHHRGQIHAMVTAAGAKPDDTDLFLLAAHD